jgi:hypothetical protein
VLDDSTVEEFRAAGVVVLRRFFDPGPLSDEVDRALGDGLRSGSEANTSAAGSQFRYVPMMCETTPVSLALLDDLVSPAAQLLGDSVIPTRAKATRYLAGSTAWHRDSDLPLASVGFAGYLEPLDGPNGALRVRRGSHRPMPAGAADGDPIATVPGDIIAFDEHLWHSSTGGGARRQWRVDFVVDPADGDELLRTYFAAVFQPGWDGGYDVDRYPSYGLSWQRSGRPWADRLGALGVYELADAEEAWVRQHRPPS